MKQEQMGKEAVQDRKSFSCIVKYVFLPGYKERTEFLEDILLPYIYKTKSVLDAGCGTSNHLIDSSMVECFIGCDLDKAALSKNSEVSGKVVGDLEHMCFRDNSFDIILTSNVFEHLEDPARFMKDVSGYLKRGGHILSSSSQGFSF